MDGIKEALSHKILGLPGWVWLLIGVGLFFVFSRTKQSSQASQDYAVPSPTSDQMSANSINDLKNSLQTEIDDKFGDITQANADANAGTQQQLTDFMNAQTTWFQQLIDQEHDAQDALNNSNQSYMTQLAQQNQAFLDMITNLLQSNHNVAPPQTSDPIVRIDDPGYSAPNLPGWLVEKLRSSYWMEKAYIRKDETNLPSQYSEALNYYLRSDTASGLNVNKATQAATDQLNQLIASGQVVKNPYYHG